MHVSLYDLSEKTITLSAKNAGVAIVTVFQIALILPVKDITQDVASCSLVAV